MLNDKGERELAYVVRIDDVRPIEGADRVELAVVGGWTVMVVKGQFHTGDSAVYFEIDSKVPEKEPFLFLADKHYKIKTQKYFKGKVISQGLLMPFDSFGWEADKYQVGDFLTETLEVKYSDADDNTRKSNKQIDKYQKMANRNPKIFKNPITRWLFMRGWGKKLLFIFYGRDVDKVKKFPDWVVKTDEERVQNIPYVVNDKSPWVVTEKIDGTSTTFTMRRTVSKILKKPRYEFYVCSRNVALVDPNDKTFYPTNVYAEMAEKYDVREVLKDLLDKRNLEWVTLQGETYGQGIQKRDYGMTDHDFAGFNLVFSDRGRLSTSDAASIMEGYGIPWVPIIDTAHILPDSVEQLLQEAEGKSLIDGKEREGFVIRSQDGSKSFKVVSNSFLLKYHG